MNIPGYSNKQQNICTGINKKRTKSEQEGQFYTRDGFHSKLKDNISMVKIQNK